MEFRDGRLGAQRVLVMPLPPPGAWPRTRSFSAQPQARVYDSPAQGVRSEGLKGISERRKGT